MMNKNNMQAHFEKAGLELDFAKESFARGAGAEDIFGLDIRRRKLGDPNTEYFLMWPGHEDTSVVVRDTDKSFGQILLTVSEAEREFEDRIASHRVKWALERAKGDADQALKDMVGPSHRGYPKVKVWHPKKLQLTVINKTPKGSRTFLLGMDERQLFMTQVNSRCTTVKQAHDSLKSQLVTFFEGKAGGKTVRQGEWFFVNLTQEEDRVLKDAIRKKLVVPKCKVPIGSYAGRTGGKPHTADELVIADLTSMPETVERTLNTVLHTVHPDIVRSHGANEKGLEEMLRFNNITRRELVEWIPSQNRLVVKLPRAQTANTVTRNPQANRPSVFVRGAVRHLDHETVKFSGWRRVIANTENAVAGGVGAGRAAGGGTWID